MHLLLDLVVIGRLYMAYLDGCWQVYIPAKAKALAHEGASALVSMYPSAASASLFGASVIVPVSVPIYHVLQWQRQLQDQLPPTSHSCAGRLRH